MSCQFRAQSSTAIQSQASWRSYTLTQSRQWLAKKTRIATLVVLLGLGGGFWVTTFVAPEYAQAQPEATRSLVRQPDETYEDLLRRAEMAANDEAQANFDQGDGVKNIAITILAQNQGEIAPILSLQVSRDQWRERPEAQRWATYFTDTKVLLGFEDVTATPNQPYTDTAPATPEQRQSDTSAETRSSEDDFDGAARQPGVGLPRLNPNPASVDGSATPEDGSATPTSNPVPNGGSLLTPQPAVQVTPQMSNPGNNSTTETPGNGFVNPQEQQEQPNTTDTTSGVVDD